MNQKNSNLALARLESQIAQLNERVDRLLAQETDEQTSSHAVFEVPSTVVWGVPFSCLTFADTFRMIDSAVQRREPVYFITANLNYAMLTSKYAELREVNQNAAFITCDGMPMVWWSRLSAHPIPERVAGSELIYALTKWASAKSYRVFFLGGAPGVASTAADKLVERYPGLQVAGVESPPFRPMSDDEENRLADRIRAARPDLLYVAFGQPKGELWIAKHYRSLGIPVSVQLGASFDFVAGGIPRAPRWIQRIGMEWSYRLYQEPRRLAGRYWRNGLFLTKAVVSDICQSMSRKKVNSDYTEET